MHEVVVGECTTAQAGIGRPYSREEAGWRWASNVHDFEEVVAASFDEKHSVAAGSAQTQESADRVIHEAAVRASVAAGAHIAEVEAPSRCDAEKEELLVMAKDLATDVVPRFPLRHYPEQMQSKRGAFASQ